MPIDGQVVRVSGIKEVRSALRRLGDAEALTEVREALKAGAEIVAAETRKRIPVGTGRARDSVRATAGGNKAYVNGGKASVPYYGWLDFGTRTPMSGRPRSVGPWAKSGKGPDRGRFIYPALDDTIDQVVDKVGDGLEAFARKERLK